MKNYPAVESVIRNDVNVKALPRLIAEWNMNRYANPTVVNYPEESLEGFDPALFPIESLVDPIRPKYKGINKARFGMSLISHQTQRGPDSAGNLPAKFYVCDVDDTYKYWTSPRPTYAASGGVHRVLPNTAVQFPANGGPDRTWTGGYSVSPTVTYDSLVEVNKIVVKFENTYVSPREFYIQVTKKANPSPSTTSSDWTTIASRSSAGAQVALSNEWRNTGVIEIYYNGDGTSLANWTAAGRQVDGFGLEKVVGLRGVRVLVASVEPGYTRNINGTLTNTARKNGSTITTVDPTSTHVDIIEIGARLEMDLSRYVQTMSSDRSAGQADALVPIGGVSKGQGEVVLNNIYEDANGNMLPGLFSRNNPASRFKNIIDANVEFRGYYEYFNPSNTSIGVVPEFVMYTENWAGQDEDEVTVSLTDGFKFFDEGGLQLQASLWENLPVVEIICRVLDSVGFNDYMVDDWNIVSNSLVIPIFYTTGEDTLIEVLDQLAIAAQLALFFDSAGRLKIKQRESMFNPTAPAVWSLSTADKSVTESGKTGLGDLFTLSEEAEYDPNKYTISYAPQKWSEYLPSGALKQEVVWEAEGTTTLRASALTKTLELTDTTIGVGVTDAASWPFEGILNIDGEYIKYKGKGYSSYETSTTPVWKAVHSKADVDKIMSKTPEARRHLNKYSGSLIIEERGYWGTVPRRHRVIAKSDKDAGSFGWNVMAYTQDRGGYSQVVKSGMWALMEGKSRAVFNTKGATANHFIRSLRGSAASYGFTKIGTRMMFNQSGNFKHQQAGIVFNHDGSGDNRGYYLELTPSRITNVNKKRGVNLYVIKPKSGGGTEYHNIASVDKAIVEGVDTEVDIFFKNDTNHHRIVVSINGVPCMTVNVAKSGTSPNKSLTYAPNGLCGLWAKGETNVSFEYFYATRKDMTNDAFDGESLFDSIGSGNLNQYWDKVEKFTPVKLKRKKGSKRTYPQTIIDDFGPFVHEVREFDVKFEPKPVQHSRLGLYNTWSATCLEYVSNPFGAKFIIANTSRQNAVLSGEDSIAFPSAPVDVPFHVYGRVIVEGEKEEVVVSNDEQIRRRGLSESIIESPWIQTKEMAEALGDWLKTQWSYGHQTVSVELFGNPLLELGDVVRVYYPERHIDGLFYVTSTNNSFDEGLKTSVMLRQRITSS